MANYKFCNRLRNFVQMAQFINSPLVGFTLPMSFRKSSFWTRSVVIYPQDGYGFFMGHEIQDIAKIADSFGLSVVVDVENGVPVIRVLEYIKH